MAKKNKDEVKVPEEVASVKEPVSTQPTEAPAKKLDFNVWFAMREKKIPGHHLREIVWADFKGRGLSAKETLETFDKALCRYGIKL